MSKPAPSDESKCDLLIATMFGASSIVRLGQKGRRTPNTKGLPDRLYFAGPRICFWEVKSANDYLSPEQVIFLTHVLERNGFCGCGNREDLLELLNAANPRKVALAQIERYRNRIGR